MDGCIGQQKTNLNKTIGVFQHHTKYLKRMHGTREWWGGTCCLWSFCLLSLCVFDSLFLKKTFLLETNVVDLLGNSHNRVTS